MSLAGLVVPAYSSLLKSAQSLTPLPNGYTQQLAAQLQTLWSANYIKYRENTIFDSPSIHHVFSIPGAAAMTADGGVSMIDLRTGAPLWQSGIESRIGGADDQAVYLPVASNRIDALHSSSGELKWRYLLETAGYDLYSEGKIYSSSNAVHLWLRGVHNPIGGFLTLDKNSGQRLWDSGTEIIHGVPDTVVAIERTSTISYTLIWDMAANNGNPILRIRVQRPTYFLL